jgi:hypothetical protein
MVYVGLKNVLDCYVILLRGRGSRRASAAFRTGVFARCATKGNFEDSNVQT